MSSFGVFCKKVTIQQHPNADAIELAHIGDYVSIVRKGMFKTGDLVAYIPEASIVSDRTIKELGLEGKLSGSQKNRVKAIKLRGVLSQGLCYPAKTKWKEGDEVSQELGVIKYEPPIPTCLTGDVQNSGHRFTVIYDVENFKTYPDILQKEENVIFTEKLHGTFGMFVLVPDKDRHEVPDQKRFLVASKGLGGRGLTFKFNEKNIEKNLYTRCSLSHNIEQKMMNIFSSSEEPVILCGEVFGHGLQDLAYGHSVSKNELIGFRVFDICIGYRGNQRYLSNDNLNKTLEDLNLKRVPMLYNGPFSKEKMLEYTNGKETISGKEMHIREGIVVRPTTERKHPELGRVQLKSLSENYLLRKGGTEFN